jgi:hypothetical protein
VLAYARVTSAIRTEHRFRDSENILPSLFTELGIERHCTVPSEFQVLGLIFTDWDMGCAITVRCRYIKSVVVPVNQNVCGLQNGIRKQPKPFSRLQRLQLRLLLDLALYAISTTGRKTRSVQPSIASYATDIQQKPSNSAAT